LKLTFNNERVLAVMAHPDDAELLCAGTLARARDDGAAVAVCVMCQGDKGVAAAAAGEQQQGGDDLGQLRKREAADAAALIGATLYWFEARDGELFDTHEARRKLVEIYRQFRPTLVITHCPEDYHPDHRATGVVAEAATWFAASHGHVTDSRPIDASPGLWRADALNMAGFTPEFYVDVTPHIELKRKMLACHRSQLARGSDSDFSPLAELMERQCRARGEQSGVGMAEAFRWQHSFKRVRAW
jgi:LmbE family N-acetylglucosaminyl deacetylase